MSNISYRPQDAQQKDFAKAVRRNVNAFFKEQALSTKGDGPFVVKAMLMLAVYFVPFILVTTIPMSAWWGSTCAVISGVGMAGVGMSVMHDGVHGSASRHTWVNDLMGASMYLMGSSVLTWRIQHNGAHHTHTNIDQVDGDLDSRGLLRFSEHATLKPVHRFQHMHAFFFYGFLTITKLAVDFATLAAFNKDGSTAAQKADPKREMIKLIVLKVVYIAVFIVVPLVFSGFLWWQVLLGFFVMHFVASVILGTVFQLAHIVEGTVQPMPDIQGVIPNDWTVHEMMTTSDFARNSRLLTWFTGGLNHQIEHHLFPHVCHVHYRRIAPIVERTAREHGVPYNNIPTFGAALASHVRRMKQLGRPANDKAA
ncbi:MAG: acyl-CoA desaturase [Flavobacteriales bacterium]|nr:acyl-CoA desaturase [Flavobacteriales bacterium]